MGFEIDMAGAFDSPEQLRLWGPVEERGRLSDRGAIVVRAERQQHGRSRLRDMVDGAKIGRAQVENRRQQKLEKPRERSRHHRAESRTENNANAVRDRRADLRVYGLEHE